MKFSINTKLLIASLATLKPICKASTTYPILSNVCITADKENITLLGMDGEKQLSIRLACKVKETGATTLSCSRLYDSLIDSDAQDCVIETTKDQTTIRDGSAVSKILGLPVTDMVEQVKIGEGEGVMISAEKFNELMGFALLHSSQDETKALMNSVILLARNEKLNFQASDYKHAIICATELGFDETDKFIVPRDSVAPLVKIATEGDVELLFGENSMSVKTEGIEFRTKLLDGNIPEFEGAYPKERPLKITVSRKELERIVKRAEKGTSEQARYIILGCDGSKLVARGQGAVISNDTESFFDMNEDSTKVKKGSAVIEVKLNPVYLRDALKCMKGEEVTLEMVDNRMPVVIIEEGIRCSICPMKLE